MVDTSPVWITGTGTVNCASTSPEGLLQAVIENRSGVEAGIGQVRDQWLSEVKPKMDVSPFRRAFHSLIEDYPKSKPLLFPLFAISEAMRNAGWSQFREDDGFIFATTTGGVTYWDQPFFHFLKDKGKSTEFRNSLRHQPLGALLQSLRELIHFEGKIQLVTSACSASTQALALGAMWLKQGRVKRCLVGGAEVLCELTLQGFRSLQLLSPEPTMPFDENRKGINLSEGAGFICIETGPKVANPQAQLSGYGISTDGFHMTAPQPQGLGSLRAMKSALHSARLSPQDIDWIHAHGTGSQHNDSAEGEAVSQLFEEMNTWVSSTKWVHGHALGASGVLESILCVEALKKSIIFKTGGLKSADKSIRVQHPMEHFSHPLNHVLKNTLGFGGSNASVILSRADWNPR